METIVRPLAPYETSYAVSMLHKALAALGMAVSVEEAARRLAGDTTIRQVRILQRQLNLPANDDLLVDETTAGAITKLLLERGLLEAEHSFVVTGTVRLFNGRGKKQQPLLAFDLDLRGVGAYRTAKHVDEITTNDGFEYLGEAVSDASGRYRIAFYAWQYGKAERKKADIVIYAVDEKQIIGRSRLVNSNDYSDTGLVSDLDIIITHRDSAIEYETLMRALLPFLEESQIGLAKVATSRDQLVFLAGELDVEQYQIDIAAAAELLASGQKRTVSHELLYGIGRQNLTLSWVALARKSEQELREAIASSVAQRIIHQFSDDEIAAFLNEVRGGSVEDILNGQAGEDRNSTAVMLKNALPEESQRVAFLGALNTFQGSDFQDFWGKHLPSQEGFKDNPHLVSSLLLTQQLSALSGNHQSLVHALQVERGITSIDQTMDLDLNAWYSIIKQAGVPEFIPGDGEEAKTRRYASLLANTLNAAFPTKRIAKLVDQQRLPIADSEVAKKISNFLAQSPQFDFAQSRIDDFDEAIREVGGSSTDVVRDQLLQLQRVFQVSPNPQAMAVLMEANLTSAYSIANIPRKSFMKTYSKALGSEEIAFAVHERASHISTRAEFAFMHMNEYAQFATPAYALGHSDLAAVQKVLANLAPNYAALFGSPDICECQHCRSVYSAAAYLVDLLRFLWRGVPNSAGKTPLALLNLRRPDLIHLPLTCENVNTLIPYIDLTNEILEYYTAHGSLASFEGYDTGAATAEELRANPQNFNLVAYRTLNDARYPFTLPYHQPLDVIRTYSTHLKVSRYEAMKVMTPDPDTNTTKAIEAEALRLSPDEYGVLTGEAFDGTLDATPLHEYYGYAAAGELEAMSNVREFLHRSGLAYTDLVELVRTRFINPFQNTLEFLDAIFAYASIGGAAVYNRLEQIEAGTLNPATDAEITAALTAYSSASGSTLTPADFGKWVADHLGEFRQVITLYEPASRCDLDTSELRTIQSIYEGTTASGISTGVWSKIHRFIRLWRKLEWTIHEVDLMLTALNETELSIATISMLASVSALQKATKLPLNQLATLWGAIDTYGDKSLYRKLFLNKAAQQIDEAFEADIFGDYLQDPTEVLIDHQSTILAAFRISEGDLAAILEVAEVIDGGNPRLLDLAADRLSLPNLSTIYRYVVLARGLKMRTADLCQLIGLFAAAPFSRWDIQQAQFSAIAPAATGEFYQLAASTKETGFKAVQLEYILQGTLPADSTLGLDSEQARQTVRGIRDAFAVIELDHPETPLLPLTVDALTAKLSLTFGPEIVSQLMALLNGSPIFQVITDPNLDVTIPDSLAAKYSYVKASGRLTSAAVMSDSEQGTLRSLPNANANFQSAVDTLYDAPEIFLATNFSGVFADLAQAAATLLDHPTQAATASLDDKLLYVYQRYLPLLKDKLRHDVLTLHISTLIGLSAEATALLIADDSDALIADLSSGGFSATYFNAVDWTNPALDRVDAAVDFDWNAGAPDPAVAANNFSVRWSAYLVAPASGEYTLIVEVNGADEAFKLYLDQELILEKAAAAATSLEVAHDLNAAQMHLLTLEYAEAAQNAGITLAWKTATTAVEVVPSSVTYPAGILDAFVAQATLYHRAGSFINGFALSETELDHFLTYPANFGNLDFQAIDVDAWQRMRDYSRLRGAVPQAQALLTDVFVLANTPSPAPTLADLKTLLHLATAWDATSLDFLVDTHFGLDVDAFKNEIALLQLRDVVRIVGKTGLSAQTLADWGAVETDFDVLHDTSQLIKNAVKAKYEEEDWLDIAGEMSDQIRSRQQSALVSYLLTVPAIQAWGVTDADGLFEYFLIDVQMGPCMETSRVVQANAAIQMFVNRCLLNLESDMSTGVETGVSPDAIDQDRWLWMQNYRVWEANRKVFLYPENLLEPEWRNDRSEFFRELESYLVQNDITERSVEQGFRNYLTSLNGVANLDVVALCREDYTGGNLKYLHVFARTNVGPYKYYYRRWDEYMKWSAWESVAVDIRGVDKEAGGGVHLIPVVWKNRLFLFWPEFLLVRESPAGSSNQTTREAADKKISELESLAYWEVKLAYSEYIDGKWTPKQITKESMTQKPNQGFSIEGDLLFTPGISATQELTITVSDRYWNILRGTFRLADIQSPVQISDNVKIGMMSPIGAPPPKYLYDFMKRRTAFSVTLNLEHDTYLQTPTTHSLLPIAAIKGLDITIASPFFFSDAYRTYFVRPTPISIIQWMQAPETVAPYIPEYVDDSGFTIPIDIPDIGPDDYLPSDIIVQPVFDRMTDMRTMDAVAPAAGGIAALAGREPFLAMAVGAGASDVGAADAGAADVGASPTALHASRARRIAATRAYNVPVLESANTYDVKSYAGATGSIVDAFYGTMTGAIGTIIANYWLQPDTGLEFHTFHHPYSSQYMTSLNQGGAPALLECDTSLPSDNGSTFQTNYKPNFTNGFVQKPSDFAARTYYKENVCFDVFGANSIYNWELFFHAPLYIATRLSKNGQYKEALKWFHTIFDPTTDEMPGAGESEISRYWKVLPFKTTPATSLEDWFKSLSPNSNPTSENAVIGEWRDNPFDPHLIAANRPLAYMKHVVIKYVENLLDWGDSLFRQFTRESVNEALQLYVIANHILGPRPQFIPARGAIQAESYDSLHKKWDDFSNALVEMENLFPYSSAATASTNSTGTSLLGAGPSLYFCIPANDKLLGYWDRAADRLYKIRHCQDIDGVERKLALFAPPIDPALLVQAFSQGLSMGSILADLSSPPPIYRFTYLIQKANEFCSDVKALGAALLAALEMKDAEELGRLRASHETSMLELITGVQERQVLAARSHKENLLKGRDLAIFRLNHYVSLLGSDGVSVPGQPALSATLTAESQLPADTTIEPLVPDVDQSVVDSGEAGVKLIAKEKEEIDNINAARDWQIAAQIAEGIAAIGHIIPTVSGDGKPYGIGVGASWGGTQIGNAASAAGKVFDFIGSFSTHAANLAAKMSAYIRREQEWTLHANLAAKEIVQIDKQITLADIQIQVAERELANHKQQIENAKAVELFLKNKFTNQELYQWMKEQLFAVYKQSYNLACDMIEKAKKAYRYEIGTDAGGPSLYGIWDNSKQGLVAGEKLQLALRQLEKAYLDENRRELELTKNISLAMLNPLALIKLRETGICNVSLPEELLDLEFQGHYFRRIKSVRLSIPCIAGPYTTVNCTLRLLNNSTRINTAMNSAGKYEHENDEGLPLDDSRFRSSYAPVTSIAVSTAQNDSGMFEFSFRDERYLPFEGAGAISDWQMELTTDPELRQFDYSTISDVVLHLNYTARETGGLFKANAITYIKEFLANVAELSDQPLMRMFSMRHDFPTDWYRFLRPAAGQDQVLNFTLGMNRFPFFVQGRTVVVMKLEIFGRCAQEGDYHLLLSYTDSDGAAVTSDQTTMPESASYGGLKKVTLNVTDAGLNLEELDVSGPISLKIKHSTAVDFASLAVDPPEVEEVYLVIHYKLD